MKTLKEIPGYEKVIVHSGKKPQAYQKMGRVKVLIHPGNKAMKVIVVQGWY